MKRIIFFIAIIFLFSCRAKKERTNAYKLSGTWEVVSWKEVHKTSSGRDSIVEPPKGGEIMLAPDNTSSVSYPDVPPFNSAYLNINFRPGSLTFLLAQAGDPMSGAIQWYGDIDFKRFSFRHEIPGNVIEYNTTYTITKITKNKLELYFIALDYSFEEFVSLKRK